MDSRRFFGGLGGSKTHAYRLTRSTIAPQIPAVLFVSATGVVIAPTPRSRANSPPPAPGKAPFRPSGAPSCPRSRKVQECLPDPRGRACPPRGRQVEHLAMVSHPEARAPVGGRGRRADRGPRLRPRHRRAEPRPGEPNGGRLSFRRMRCTVRRSRAGAASPCRNPARRVSVPHTRALSRTSQRSGENPLGTAPGTSAPGARERPRRQPRRARIGCSSSPFSASSGGGASVPPRLSPPDTSPRSWSAGRGDPCRQPQGEPGPSSRRTLRLQRSPVRFHDPLGHRIRQRILKSSHSDQLSTYQTSSSRLLSQLAAFRPFTCDQPVIPGSTS